MPVVRRAVLGAVLAHRRHRNPIGEGDAAEAQRFEQGGRSCHRMDQSTAALAIAAFESRQSIADDRAALVTYPISEAQIVDPHVVKTGAHRRRGTQSGPAAAFAMGHNMVARAKPDPLQHRA